jgi:hypothetical protein
MGAPGRVGSRRTRAVERSFAGFSFLLAALVLAACGSTTAPGSTTTTTFVDNPQSYADTYVYMFPARSHDLDHPYLKGKVVIVDKGASERGFHPGDFDESVVREIRSDGYGKMLAGVSNDDMTLIHPNEVGTVVWVFCKKNVDAGWSYTDGLEAYETTCIGTVIDKAKDLVVGVKTFHSEPPNRIMCPAVGICEKSKSVAGLDAEAFARWIEQMPRK